MLTNPKIYGKIVHLNGAKDEKTKKDINDIIQMILLIKNSTNI